MPRLRAVWAILQSLVTVATFVWGAYLLPTTHEVIWGSGNFAAGVFFLVTIFLFAANHRDGRLVGAVGLGIFVLVNAFLIFSLLTTIGCSDPTSLQHVPSDPWQPTPTNPNKCYQGLERLSLGEDWTREKLALLIGGVIAMLAVPEALILLFGHGPGKHAEPEAFPEAPPPM